MGIGSRPRGARLYPAGLLIAACLAALLPSPAASADEEPLLPARLIGRAVLPAASFLVPPDGVPDALAVSGKFLGPERTRTEGVGVRPARNALSPRSGPQGSRLATPFAGQPVQGLSGLIADGAGGYLALSDNGFGNKANSPDAMLMVHRLAIDLARGTVVRRETIFLSDPQRRLPFPIAMEGTRARYLTGADLDPESIQKVGDRLFIGDEFGPFLVETDLQGQVQGLFEARLDGTAVRGPDHPALSLPGVPGGRLPDYAAARSKGFEGLALSPDGRTLLALLEGPLRDAGTGAREAVGEHAALRILEFDISARAFTGRSWRYLLAAPNHAIGDMVMIDARRALVIERDERQGDPALRCAEPPVPAPCFAEPARYKRVVLVELPAAGAGEPVRRLGAIDLLAIDDPDGRAGADGRGGRFAFPFVTIESLLVVGPGQILVGNDNNLPSSAGRTPLVSDDTEFVLLDVPALRTPGTQEDPAETAPPPAQPSSSAPRP